MRARALLMDTTDGAWKSAEWASATGHFLGHNKSLQISQQKSQRSQRESVICHLPRVPVGAVAPPRSSSPAPEPTRRRSPASPPFHPHGSHGSPRALPWALPPARDEAPGRRPAGRGSSVSREEGQQSGQQPPCSRDSLSGLVLTRPVASQNLSSGCPALEEKAVKKKKN